ncbi:DUF6058 family natural product biosynthesis protein [Fodinicola acaciae]|uniref:DUF6058 family natural product biosynthesis protein n=1 Tax=Fodinicola acaciae TaxID=2681555 RepID=UPI0013D6C52B|nr:DUF6058 family natural product biosynthesis protein [Fodinicola acaciae]
MTLSADRIDLRMTISRRYRVVNGDHPMSPADDAYVDRQYAPLEDVAAAHGVDPDEVREHVIAGRLPLPSYLRSDGTEMYHSDLFGIVERAGGVEFLREWFVRQFRDPVVGREEWRSYLSGQYVCLRSVTPRTIQRKEELVTAIQLAVAEPRPRSSAWLDQLHDWVDELDALSPAYTGYDVLRFGGPTGRQTNIDAVRHRFPRR